MYLLQISPKAKYHFFTINNKELESKYRYIKPVLTIKTEPEYDKLLPEILIGTILFDAISDLLWLGKIPKNSDIQEIKFSNEHPIKSMS